MLDNSQDKGYICIELKEKDNDYVLTEISINKSPDVTKLYIDYEDGCIYINWGANSPKDIIGYYDKTADDVYLAKVYDSSKKNVIGRVGQELIYFRKRDKDYSAGRYSPEEECLAYYTKGGRITPINNILTDYGIIFGSEIGGAAAFVAVFNSYKFKCIFRDFFELDYETFKRKHASYLN